MIFGNGRHLAWNQVFLTTVITASLESLRHQEAVCRYAQRGVMVKPTPASSFLVPQSQILFQILFQVLVSALDSPAHVSGTDQIVQCSRLWQSG